MRKMILSAATLALLVACYAIWPMVSAYQIKQAIRTGDVATLERKVQWAPVRASIKESLAALSPTLALSGDDPRATRGQPVPSIWTRVKAAAAPVMVDRFVDAYITAEGVTKLRDMRQSTITSLFGFAPAAPTGVPRKRWFAGWRSAPTLPPPAEAAIEETNSAARFLSFYNRIARARFHSLSLAEFEIADKHNPERRIVSQFQLVNFEWTLASVRIVGAGF